MLTVIIPIISVMPMVAVTYDHHPAAAIGANNPCVPTVLVSVIISACDPDAPIMIFPVVIPILGFDRKG
ncbi:MAG: hypothetical protein V7641_4702 [Blastocatellia bacterium]